MALRRFTLREHKRPFFSPRLEAALTLTEPTPQRPSVSTADREDVSVFDILTPLVRQRRLILLTALSFALVTAIVVLLLKSRYTAEVTFVPEAPKESSLSSSLGGLASQFGLGAQFGTAYSADFMAEVLESRHIREALLKKQYPAGNGQRTLLQVMDPGGSTPEKQLEAGLRDLEDATEINVDKGTGVVSARVTLHNPALAAAVANDMIEELNRFNVERRRSQSGEERRFTERRLQELRQELADAEEELIRFLQRNRQFAEFSVASVGARRLERRVQLKQEVLASMSRAHEEARINEVRDTPVLTVIDRAERPVWKSFPKRTLSVLVALVIGTVVGIALAYLAEARRRVHQEGRPDYRDFLTAMREARKGSGRRREAAQHDVG